jgi:UDP-hydrolysing UDP-N-acetyl-D-glucosamine 2-epimerase
MRICVVTGSRADWALLEWPVKLMKEDPFFQVEVLRVWNHSVCEAYKAVESVETDMLMILGDRYEILAAALCGHLRRIPIAHIAGGDVTEGSYDDGMRDAISRMASIHFVTSTSAMARLTDLGYRNIHLVGSPGIDFIRHADWFRGRPIAEPYVVVSYQPETIDGTVWDVEIARAIEQRFAVFIRPNPDRGSDVVNDKIDKFLLSPRIETGNQVLSVYGKTYDFLPHDEFLNLIKHCDCFIGNSSSMLYEAPELGIKTRMIGKRQKGRVVPWGDGHASERIIKTLKYCAY